MPPPGEKEAFAGARIAREVRHRQYQKAAALGRYAAVASITAAAPRSLTSAGDTHIEAQMKPPHAA